MMLILVLIRNVQQTIGRLATVKMMNSDDIPWFYMHRTLFNRVYYQYLPARFDVSSLEIYSHGQPKPAYLTDLFS